jgi:hypothetical protein
MKAFISSIASAAALMVQSDPASASCWSDYDTGGPGYYRRFRNVLLTRVTTVTPLPLTKFWQDRGREKYSWEAKLSVLRPLRGHTGARTLTISEHASCADCDPLEMPKVGELFVTYMWYNNAQRIGEWCPLSIARRSDPKLRRMKIPEAEIAR